MMLYEKKYLFFWGHTEKGDEVTKACLSQWYPSYMVIDNYHYWNVEQYLMAEKARTFADEEALSKIRQTQDPKDIKALGRQVKGYVDEVWVAKRREIALRANTVKFRTIPQLRKFLYETGDAVLVEASPYDRVWGIGYNQDEAPRIPEERWGENLLGQVLMEVREHLRDPYLPYCRYYDGVNYENAPANKRLLASYEEAWIRIQIADFEYLRSMFEEYIAYGQEFFSMNDGVPMSMKALLFNRWGHWGGNLCDGESFQKWYNEYYLGDK